MAEALVIEDLAAGYGNSRVLSGLSLTVAEGETLAVLGRNGMGKTSLLLSLVGLIRHHAGRIFLFGRDITRLPANQRAAAGLGWVPQERAVFPSLTVEENLIAVSRPGPWRLTDSYRLFPRLEERKRNGAGFLSGGEQQMLAIARTLMTNPRVLLLDEPLEGLAPALAAAVLDGLRPLIAQGGLTVLITDPQISAVLTVTRRAILLERGRVVHDAPSSALLTDPAPLHRWIGLGLDQDRPGRP